MVFRLTQDQLRKNLFLALKGNNNDGNKFISHAFTNGASCVATSSINKKYKKTIKIKNSDSFLRQFAKFKRNKSS